MCLYTQNIIPNIAYTDIICYKLCRPSKENYISIPKGFIYKKLEKYNNNIPLATNSAFYIDFLEKKNLTPLDNHIALGPNLFHSYKEKSDLHLNDYEAWLKCIIPKGAYYWENKYFYASSQIKILEEL